MITRVKNVFFFLPNGYFFTKDSVFHCDLYRFALNKPKQIASERDRDGLSACDYLRLSYLGSSLISISHEWSQGW